MSDTHAFRSLPLAEKDRIMDEARRLRAEAYAAAFRATGRAMKRYFARLIELRRQRAVMAALARLTERDLADIGITRHDFPAVAKGSYKRPETSAAPVAGAPANDTRVAVPEQRIAA